ncbi:hypothetical protein SDC9_92093 [bioreactor metagenome]|uniref:Uncharacterized protein n=1 Tax=bioreactor metagenome TaxID=1076179 RepID=A0A644ZXG1_9ZZZZ
MEQITVFFGNHQIDALTLEIAGDRPGFFRSHIIVDIARHAVDLTLVRGIGGQRCTGDVDGIGRIAFETAALMVVAVIVRRGRGQGERQPQQRQERGTVIETGNIHRSLSLLRMES